MDRLQHWLILEYWGVDYEVEVYRWLSAPWEEHSAAPSKQKNRPLENTGSELWEGYHLNFQSYENPKRLTFNQCA
jgi:hypothetical protein